MYQTHPFRLRVYSAFFDNRWSIGPSFTHVVVILSTPDWPTRINQCRLWYGPDKDCVTVSGSSSLQPSRSIAVKATAVHTSVIVCHLPRHISNVSDDSESPPRNEGAATLQQRVTSGSPSIPSYVSLAWGDADNDVATFRTPVERVLAASFNDEEDDTIAPTNSDADAQRYRRKSLAVCASVLYGDDLDPREVVEWFEMQRLLGVSHILIYNHSVVDRIGRIVVEYASRRTTVKDGFQVELRQTRRFTIDQKGPVGREWYGRELYRHQVPLVNDCYYRLVGRFRYIGVYDIDELIVPRLDNQSTILDLMKVSLPKNGRFIV
jgi:hypothetical protein